MLQSSSVTSLRHDVLSSSGTNRSVQSPRLNSQNVPSVCFFCQCWDWIFACIPSYKQFSVKRKKIVTAETTQKTWSQPIKKVNWVRVGSFLSAVFTQTELDSSHLESLKPAQRRAEEDVKKETNSENKRKTKWVSESVKRREKCVHSSGSRPALDCPQVLIPVSPSVSSSAISESINKTWWDGGRTGMNGKGEMGRVMGGCFSLLWTSLVEAPHLTRAE